jgi:hypothetical protein
MSYFLGLFLSIAFFLVVLLSTRKGKMRLRYSMLWLCLAFSVLLLAAFPNFLNLFSSALGIQSPINLLFFFSTVVIGFVLFLVSFENNHLQAQLSSLAREYALLEFRLRRLEGQEADIN